MTLFDATEKIRQQHLVIAGEAHGCFERRHILPGLMLLYAAIDGVAWLARPAQAQEGRDVAKHFQAWVNDYILVHGEEASAADLWAARCAVLHTQTADPRSSGSQQPRPIWYRLPDTHGVVQAVHVGPADPWIINPVHLTTKFSAGVEKWLGSVVERPDLHQTLCDRAARFFSAEIVADKGHTSGPWEPRGSR